MFEQLPTPLVEKLFDAMGDVVFCVKDRDCRYKAVNQAFADRLEVSNKSEIVGRTAIDFFPAMLADTYHAQDQTVFESGSAILDQLERITHRDGSMGWFLASKFPIVEGNEVVGLVGISQDLNTPSDSDLALANLREVVDFIKTNLDAPLRVEQLASRVGLSQVQLDRRMKRVFRLSTKKFIMKCRLEEASRRLVSSDDPLSAIALACGFSDQSAFTRQFRAATKLPPLSYRKKNLTERPGDT